MVKKILLSNCTESHLKMSILNYFTLSPLYFLLSLSNDERSNQSAMARVVENLLLLVCARTREQDERKERSNADVESEKKAKGGCSEGEHLSLSLCSFIF